MSPEQMRQRMSAHKHVVLPSKPRRTILSSMFSFFVALFAVVFSFFAFMVGSQMMYEEDLIHLVDRKFDDAAWVNSTHIVHVSTLADGQYEVFMLNGNVYTAFTEDDGRVEFYDMERMQRLKDSGVTSLVAEGPDFVIKDGLIYQGAPLPPKDSSGELTDIEKEFATESNKPSDSIFSRGGRPAPENKN